jgi:hypothetical protein
LVDLSQFLGYFTCTKDTGFSLSKDPLLDPEDKTKIQELLKKPWNPYIRRHSALTEKSKILKEHTLRQHAGWSTTNMHQKYIHYFGNIQIQSLAWAPFHNVLAFNIKLHTAECKKKI